MVGVKLSARQHSLPGENHRAVVNVVWGVGVEVASDVQVAECNGAGFGGNGKGGGSVADNHGGVREVEHVGRHRQPAARAGVVVADDERALAASEVKRVSDDLAPVI